MHTQTSSAGWPTKYNCLKGFNSLLNQEEVPKSSLQPEGKFMSFLKGIKKDHKAPALDRCDAAFTYGLMKWLLGDRESAARNYSLAIDINASAIPEERSRKVHTSFYVGHIGTRRALKILH